MPTWSESADDLVTVQRELAARIPSPWQPLPGRLLIAGCFVCFPKGYTGSGASGDPAHAAAAMYDGRRRVVSHVVAGAATAPYEPGLLALREGPLLEAVVRGLATPPDVLLVNATGRDHPRQAGLALHLGAVLGLPTVGLTHRPLLAAGDWPDDSYGATSPLRLDGDVVGSWVRTRKGARPLAVHAAWRTDVEQATETVLRCWCRRRTPEPLRAARRLARLARARSERSVP
jgi:deoxyribonuclease V